MNPKVEKGNIFFSEEGLDCLQAELGNLSNAKMKKVATWLRNHAGRKSVAPFYREHMSAQSKKLGSIYKKDVLPFSNSKGDKVMRPVVWADASELVEVVRDIRGYVGSVFIKAMADGGQKFLKICLTLLPEGYDPIADKVPTDEDTDHSSLQGTSGSKLDSTNRGRLTGVKRLLLLCTVPDVPETHSNMEILFDLTQLNSISYIFVADFKLFLTVLGLQTATASYPCPYCEITLKDMRNKSLIEKRHDTCDDMTERTFGSLKTDIDLFQKDYASKKSCAPLTHSYQNPSLILEDETIRIIDKCPQQLCYG